MVDGTSMSFSMTTRVGIFIGRCGRRPIEYRSLAVTCLILVFADDCDGIQHRLDDVLDFNAYQSVMLLPALTSGQSA